MRRKNRWDRFRRDISLIAKERVSVLKDWGKLHWSVWLGRAEAWDAERKFESALMQDPQHAYSEADEALLSDNWHRVAISNRIQRSAERYGIEIPDDCYEIVSLTTCGEQGQCLTRHGVQLTLPKIQVASRALRQEYGYWFSLFIGAIGAITGLVAVLR